MKEKLTEKLEELVERAPSDWVGEIAEEALARILTLETALLKIIADRHCSREMRAVAVLALGDPE